MTEKRFVEIENEWVKDTETGDEWEYAIECMSTLNQLFDIATNLGDFRSFITEDMQKTKEENEQLKKEKQELEQFKLSIISFAECNENINHRTLNELIELIDYD